MIIENNAVLSNSHDKISHKAFQEKLNLDPFSYKTPRKVQKSHNPQVDDDDDDDDGLTRNNANNNNHYHYHHHHHNYNYSNYNKYKIIITKIINTLSTVI